MSSSPPARPPAGYADPDEHRHDLPEGAPVAWAETYSMDFVSVTGSLGGWATVTIVPGAATVWYWACLAGPDRSLVVVADHSVPLPGAGPLELRTSGLWADHVIETPWDHMSLGLEAFGLGLDDADEMLGPEPRGHLVPLGFELDFDTAAGGAQPVPSGYEIPCTVHGEILVGDEAIDFSGVGFRFHRWGAETWREPWDRVTVSRPDGTAHAGWFRGDADGPPGIEVLARVPLRVEVPGDPPGRLVRELWRHPDGGLGWADRYRPG